MVVVLNFAIFHNRHKEEADVNYLSAEESSNEHACNFPKVSFKILIIHVKNTVIIKNCIFKNNLNILSHVIKIMSFFWELYSIIVFLEIISKKFSEHFTGISKVIVLQWKEKTFFSC